MRFFSIILFLIISTVSFSQPQKAEKKKQKTKGGDKSQTSALSKADKQKAERLLLEAEKAKVTEDWDEAVKNYRELLLLDANNGNAHFQLAQIFIQQKNLTEAEREATEAVKKDASNKWYLELLANIYLSQGRNKEAAEAYKTLIQKFPNNGEMYLELGFIYARAGQLENAIKIYDLYEKNFGIDESVVIEKKNMYLRLNKFNEAVNEIHKLVDAFPGEATYMLMEADLYRANRMKDKATELYKKILETEPDNPQALLALADMDMRNGNAQQSLESMKKIFENPKMDVDTKIRILYPYLQYWEIQKDKKQDAFNLAEILTATHPAEPKGFAIKGDLYSFDNQYEKALQSYKRALELNKDVIKVWEQVLFIYNSQRNWDSLLVASSEALEYFPNNALIYLFKGSAEEQKKQYEQAIKTFTKGEKMSGDNDKLRAQFFANLGDTYHSLNQLTESDSAYERSLRLDPDNAYVLNNYSYYLSLRKTNLERAKQMSAYSNKLSPNNSSFLDTYAWILFQLNDFAGAKEWQEKALKAEGGKSGTILEHYGDILFQLGNKEEAIQYWKQAKELGTDSETIERKINEGKYIE